MNIKTNKKIITPCAAQALAMEYGCTIIFHDKGKKNITISGKNEEYKRIVKKILEGE